MAYDLKKEDDVKEFLDNLGVEYRFGCYKEKKPDVCHLLGDYLEGVKKDFEKAARVYRSNCDDYKFGKSCYKFGNYSFLGKGCKANQEVAFNYYKRGCELGNPESCLNSGLLCVSDSPNNKKTHDYTQGLDFFDKGCQGNNAVSCYYASGLFISGVESVIQKDMTKAHNYALKACELGNVYSCANLSQMYKKGDGVEKNEALAEKYKKKSVEMQEELNGQFRQITLQEGA